MPVSRTHIFLKFLFHSFSFLLKLLDKNLITKKIKNNILPENMERARRNRQSIKSNTIPCLDREALERALKNRAKHSGV